MTRAPRSQLGECADAQSRPIDRYEQLQSFPDRAPLGAPYEPPQFGNIPEVHLARWLLGDTDNAPPVNAVTTAFHELIARVDLPVERDRQIQLRWKAIAPAAVIDLVTSLRRLSSFAYGRRVAAMARDRLDLAALDTKPRNKLFDGLVTCTYLDPEAPPRVALPMAEQYLRESGFGQTQNGPPDPNLLALAGAIERRWWEVDGNIAHLERACQRYTTAYTDKVELELEDDRVIAVENGYPAGNVAFLLDLITFVESGGEEALANGYSPFAGDAHGRQTRAQRIRERLVELGTTKLSGDLSEEEQYWLCLTLAEAFFGLGDIAGGARMVERSFSLAPPQWVLRSSARQLGQLLRIRRKPETSLGNDPALEALRGVSPGFAQAVCSAYIGKAGLALSGGGFRASLYHIGVLARLAEHDILRHVEVISCVSGGAIVGAHYYLELRNLLARKRDSDITREDYLDIVHRMERDFLSGVQTDLRNQLLADRSANWRMATDPAYTRTHRLGELFEKELFSKVPDGQAREDRYISELWIQPKAQELLPTLYTRGYPRPEQMEAVRPFNPRLDNWLRKAKAPILILNATTLNTGHTWQFTASWMGEPPHGYDPLLESMPRLRQTNYSEAPAAYHRVRLGHAVVASACVPGLFEPLVLRGLHEGVQVALGDGGVHDNQGISSLGEQQCRMAIISDASGQMELRPRVGDDPLTVSLRANDVLMARVREEQFAAVRSLQHQSVLSGVLIAHLRQGLSAPEIDVIGRSRASDEAVSEPPRPCTPYGIRADVQQRISELRTDLDAFHELEATALMESGYRATNDQIGCLGILHDPDAPRMRWDFRKVGPALQSAGSSERIVAELARGVRLIGKVYSLRTEARWVAVAFVIAALVVGGVVKAATRSWVVAFVTLLAIPGGLLGVAVAVHVTLWILNVLRGSPQRATLWARLSGGFFALSGAWWARRQVRSGVPRYLERGRLSRFIAVPNERAVRLPMDADDAVVGSRLQQDTPPPSVRGTSQAEKRGPGDPPAA